jgi:hypothetical protein
MVSIVVQLVMGWEEGIITTGAVQYPEGIVHGTG